MGSCHARAPRGDSAVARPVKVLVVATHPVQYATPLYRLYGRDSRIGSMVAYCSLGGGETALDADFLRALGPVVPASVQATAQTVLHRLRRYPGTLAAGSGTALQRAR
jgi:hypothetical protein